ncbi:MAG: hypothetical protein WAV55_09915 [Clostridiaceae bacterium]
MAILFDDLKNADLVIDEIYTSNGNNNSSGDVLCKLLTVGSLGGFRTRKVEADKTKFAYIVLESTQNEIDWIDCVDIENGTVTYYGDNRTVGEMHQTKNKGNQILQFCFNQMSSKEQRQNIPPFFFFTSAGGRNRKFIGLLVPGDNRLSKDEQLIALWRTKNQVRFQNYKAIFTILDVGKIDKLWLAY